MKSLNLTNIAINDRFFHSNVDLHLDGETSEELTSLFVYLYGCPDGYKYWMSRRLSIRAFARATSMNTVHQNMSSPSHESHAGNSFTPVATPQAAELLS